MNTNYPLPNFFILGAAKAGSTSIYKALKLHPEIFLSFDKEPQFFSKDEHYKQGLGWYSQTFFSGASEFKLRGEATPHYLYWAEKVAPRMLNSFSTNELRFIVSLRNPIARAYSWYWNMVRQEEEDLDFESAIAHEQIRLKKYAEELRTSGSMSYGYFKGGCYTDQLEAYFSVFPREKFIFLLQEDLSADFMGTLQTLFSFLGVQKEIGVPIHRMNPSGLPRSRWVEHVLRKPSRAKNLVKALLPFPIRYRLKVKLLELNKKAFDYPDMDEEIAASLTDRFRDQIIRLQDLIEVDLSNWFTAYD